MRYRTSLLIGIGQTEADPALTVLDLEAGYITEVEIMFPAGQSGLTYVQIYHQSRLIFPLSPGQAFRGDDLVVQFDERFPILEVPHSVTVVGWAPDATMAHTVFVGISIEAPWVPEGIEEVYVPLPEGMF